MKQEDYYLPVVFQVGSQEAATRKLQSIKKDFVSLGKTLKGLGEQVVFSTVLLSDGWDTERRRGQVNYVMRGLCQDEGFAYYDLGQAFERLLCMCQMDGI